MPDDRNKKWVLFSILLALSFVLRLIRITQGLWYDEIFAVRFVQLSWLEIPLSMPVPNNHILFSLLAKLSISVFGEKEWSLRLPSVLFSGITPAVFYVLWRKKLGEFVAFAGGIFFCVNYWSVWFGQDARGYAGFILCVVISNSFLLRWLETRKAAAAVAYALASISGVYVFMYFFFVIAGQLCFLALGWLFKKQKIADFIAPAALALVCIAAYSPMLGDVAQYADGAGKLTEGRFLDANFLKELAILLSGSHLVIAAGPVCLLTAFGLFLFYKKWPELFLLYMIPAALILLFTLVARIFIYARFLSFLLPACSVGLALAVERLAALVPGEKKARSRLVLTGLLCFVLAVSLVRYYQTGKQGFKAAHEYVSNRYPGVFTISYGLTRNIYKYYDQNAVPLDSERALEPGMISNTLLVGAYRENWRDNINVINKVCMPEKEWPSAWREDMTVYLYRCF
jgi:mannosyltransferase